MSTVPSTALDVIRAEASAVASMAAAVNPAFDAAASAILACPGHLVCSGVGKAGHIARKVSATFASTGTPSHFLSAVDALHGDLGSVRDGDVALLFSYSGESDEITRLLNLLKKLGNPTIAITASRTSSLGKYADHVIAMGRIEEACPLRLAPSASTTAMLALGDALALGVMAARNFSHDDFARFHPAGQLGRKLLRVSEAMSFRKDAGNLPVAPDTHTVSQILTAVSTITRRPGATILTGADGRVSGVFTDGDLRRLITTRPDVLSIPIHTVMTRNPKRIAASRLAGEAMHLMQQYRIDELPVVDDDDRPIGLIDVQDLVLLRMLDVPDTSKPGNGS
jgi:arabinose-5-phosphate isomerase